MSGTNAEGTSVAEPILSALIELMVLAADADGEITEDERHEMVANVEALANGTLDASAVASRLASAEALLADKGRDAVLADVVARLPPPSREPALTLLARMTAADGIVRTSERELIMEAAEALGIDSTVAADIVRDATRGVT